MLYALLIILHFDATPPPITWHPTREACEAQAAMEAWHLEITRRPVAQVSCTPHRIPRLRPITGEIIR